MGTTRYARRRRLRGANAIEFALVAPVLVALLGGLLDYGWLFWREALAVSAVHEGLRRGATRTPDPDADAVGGCDGCVQRAVEVSTERLGELGFSGVQLQVGLERTPLTGTPCVYALVATATVPHHRIMPILPGQDEIHLRVTSLAQGVPCDSLEAW